MSVSKSITKDGKKVTVTFYIKKEAAQAWFDLGTNRRSAKLPVPFQVHHGERRGQVRQRLGC